MKQVSQVIKERIITDGGSFFANDNISKYIENGELDLLQLEVEEKMEALLSSMIIDTTNDHNTKETAKRVAKMYIREVFSGRYNERPNVTDFPNAKSLDELYAVGPMKLRSACSHHMVPIEGNVWVGVLPSDRVIGLSKFQRILDWIGTRPHIQEEMAIMLADEIEDLIKPVGLGIVIKASHLCTTWRGIKADRMNMVNSVLRGEMKTDDTLRKEFFDLIKGMGYTS